MDAKKELIERLAAMMPGMETEIAHILEEYRISRENRKDRRSLQRSVDSFLAAKKIDGLAPKTLKNYRDMLGAFSTVLDKPASRITTDDIRSYIGQLAARRLRDSSIQTHINTLRSFFGWLELEDVIRKNPMRKIKSLKIDRMAARRPLEPEELERLRDGCKTYKERALVEFLTSTGCRLGEVAGIQVDRVDWQNRSVVVLGKGHKERTVYFSVRAKLMLQEYLSTSAIPALCHGSPPWWGFPGQPTVWYAVSISIWRNQITPKVESHLKKPKQTASRKSNL